MDVRRDTTPGFCENALNGDMSEYLVACMVKGIVPECLEDV